MFETFLRRSSCFFLLAAGLAFSVGKCAHAQSSASPNAGVIQVTSRLVVLDVVVLDREGHAVPNLDRSKFVIAEDNVQQTIRDFEGPENHAMPSAAGSKVLVDSSADLPKIGSAPVNVLVIDELNTPYMQIANAQQSIRRFLEKQPAVLSVPTLFVASGNSRIVVLHDFTQSRDELLASVKQHVTQPDFDALVNTLNGGKTGSQHGFTRTIGALAEIASSLRGIPGHKNVIWVGTGYNNAYDLATASALDTDKLNNAVRMVSDRMLQSRISLSTLDPAGVAAPVEEDLNAEVDATGQTSINFTGDIGASFDQLALSTGGRVVHGRNDLDRIVNTLAEQQASYYTLSYRPTNKSDDPQAFRHIHVALTDPSLHAVTRTGYYPGADEVQQVAPNTAKKQPQVLRFDLTEAASNKLVYTGLHVAAKPAGRGYTVLVTANDLTWQGQQDGTRLAEISVIAAAFDRKDKKLAQRAMELKQQIAGTDRIDTGASIGLDVPFAIPAGTSRIRFVVRDAGTGNLGSAELER